MKIYVETLKHWAYDDIVNQYPVLKSVIYFMRDKKGCMIVITERKGYKSLSSFLTRFTGEDIKVYYDSNTNCPVFEIQDKQDLINLIS